MTSIESKYRSCIDLVEAMYVENHTNERRIRTLLEFIHNCAVKTCKSESTEDAWKVGIGMADLVARAWKDLNVIDDCNDALELFNENKEDDDYVD